MISRGSQFRSTGQHRQPSGVDDDGHVAGLRHFAGVFDQRMERIYRAIGAAPEVMGSAGAGRAKISLGLWRFTPQARFRVAMRAGLSPALSRLWFTRAFSAEQAA